MGPRDKRALYLEWSNLLLSQINLSFRIVFDGLERLPENSHSYTFLRIMIDNAPKNIRFLLISRKEPRFNIHDWQIKQQAYVLFNSDLAFTHHETKCFLREYCGLQCTEEQISKIRQSTEGWPGGLAILSQVFQRREKRDLESSTINGLLDSLRAEAFLYIAKEAFSGLASKHKRILMYSSVFEEIWPQFLDRLLNIEGSESVFQKLVKQNLFVNAHYDAKKGWVYKCHHLFRWFLKRMLSDQVGDKELNRYLRLVARASARWGSLESAAEFFLRAGEHLSAASVLRVLGWRMVRSARDEDLLNLLSRFPERIVQSKPWLLLYRSYCRRYSHAAENVTDLQKAKNMFERGGNIKGRILSLGYLMEAIVLIGRDPVSVHDLLAEAETLLSELSFSEHPREQALLWLQMGFCSTLRSKDTRDGYRASQNAYILARKLKDHPLQIQALIYSIIPLTYLGETSEADKLNNRVEKMLEKSGYPELEAVFLKTRSELLLFGGRLDLGHAAHLLEQLSERIERLGLLYVQAPAWYSELAYHIYAGNTEQAEAIGRRLHELSVATDNSFGKGFCFLLRGLLAYRLGQLNGAKELLESGLEIFRSPECRSWLHDYWFSIAAGLVHMHLGNWPQAESLFLRSLQHFTDIANQLALKEVLLSLALLQEHQGNREKALEYLESGLGLASARHFRHFTMLSPRDQVRFCLLALEGGSKGIREYAVDLLRTELRETVAQEEPQLRKHRNVRVRGTIEEVMRERHRRNRPRVHIQTLGRFRVWIGDELLPDSAWKGNQALKLLKALVALAHTRQVRKEHLIDELWPESSPKAGDKTFKVALHRLRRSLEPNLSSRFGSSYIHLKHGYLSLDTELCRTDIYRFQLLCRDMMRGIRSGDIKQAAQAFQQADALYSGDFLPDEADRIAGPVREHVRQVFIEAQFEAARLYESRGSWTKAIYHYQRIINCDPLLEEAYRRIMRLYAEQGKRSKALQVYEQCRTALRSELDMEPEETTTSLYRKIRG